MPAEPELEKAWGAIEASARRTVKSDARSDAIGSRSNEFNVAPRGSLETSLLLALLQNRFEEILVLSGENDLASLIEDGDSGGDDAILSFPRKIDDLQCGV
jgi:hypothetical protein